MTREPDLFDLDRAGPLARTTDPPTSHEAASRMTRPKRTTIQERIVELFRVRADDGRMTDWDLVERYRQRYGPTAESTIRTRRRELTDQGVIVHSGDLATRGESKRKAIIWELRDEEGDD